MKQVVSKIYRIIVSRKILECLDWVKKICCSFFIRKIHRLFHLFPCVFSLFDVCSLIRNITIHQGTKKNIRYSFLFHLFSSDIFLSSLTFFFFLKEYEFRWLFISFVSRSLYAWHENHGKFTSIVLRSTIFFDFFIYFVFVTNDLKYCLIFDNQ